MISYWTSLTVSSALISLFASLAGAVLIAANRTVLTAGVMIALALIPAATIVGIGLAMGSFSLAGQGLGRLVFEVIMVFVLSLLVFSWKRLRVHQRDSRL